MVRIYMFTVCLVLLLGMSTCVPVWAATPSASYDYDAATHYDHSLDSDCQSTPPGCSYVALEHKTDCVHSESRTNNTGLFGILCWSSIIVVGYLSVSRDYDTPSNKFNNSPHRPNYDVRIEPRCTITTTLKNEMSQYRAYFVPGKVDPMGLKMSWLEEKWSDFNIAYNPAMTKVNYPAPNNSRYTNTMLIRASAKADDIAEGTNLNTKLLDHYFQGKGANFDVTNRKIIKDEVRAALSRKMKISSISIRVKAQRVRCKQTGVTFVGDTAFSKIRTANFESDILSIRGARAGLQKKCYGLVACICKGSGKYVRAAVVGCEFRMYMHDQYADAADVFHSTAGAQEYKGSTQFHVTGAWGTGFSQIGWDND